MSVSRSSLVLGGLYEVTETPRMGSGDRAFEVRNRRVGTRFVVARSERAGRWGSPVYGCSCDMGGERCAHITAVKVSLGEMGGPDGGAPARPAA